MAAPASRSAAQKARACPIGASGSLSPCSTKNGGASLCAYEMGDAAFTLMPAGRALFGAASAGFLAFVDGQAAGGAVIWIHDGVAGLMGASMLPAFRRRGGQSALMRMRLDFARRQGCDLAYTITAPGSGSQRNAERAGFRMAYTRSKMYKPA